MHITLSRRNLLALLHKLEMPDSKCTIVKPGGIWITVEPDEVHYANREPGPMHPDTEQFISDLHEALEIARLCKQCERRCTCDNCSYCSKPSQSEKQ